MENFIFCAALDTLLNSKYALGGLCTDAPRKELDITLLRHYSSTSAWQKSQ